MPEPDAAVAILHNRAPRESILLIRRAERADDPWSGHWSFPGGWRHAVDRDPVATALRELAEECSIRLDREQVECALPHCEARRRVGRYVLVAPFVFAVDRELQPVLDAREAVEWMWVPLSDLRDPSRHRLRPIPGLPPDTLFPSVDLGCAGCMPLWGFTYRLIADWLELPPVS